MVLKDLYCELAKYNALNADEIVSIFLKEALLLKDSFKIVDGYMMKGTLLEQSGSVDSAIQFFNRAVEISERHNYQKEKLNLYNLLTFAYRAKGDFKQELEYNFKELTSVHKYGDSIMVSVTYNNIGLSYEDLKDPENALKYYLKSYQTRLNNNIDWGLILTLGNISGIYADLGDFDQAKHYASLASSKCINGCSPPEKFYINNAYGYTYLLNSELDSAEIRFKDCFEVAKGIRNTRWKIKSLKYLAEIKLRKEEVAESLIFLDQSASLLKGTEFKVFQAEILKLYSIAFQMQGDYEKSLKHLADLEKLNEGVLAGKSPINISNTISSFSEQNNRATIEVQRDLLTLKQQSVNQDRIILIFLVVLAGLLGIVLLLLLRKMKAKKRLNSLFNEKVRLRTKELHESYRQLEKVSVEQQENINSFSKKVQSGMATLKGIAQVAKLDTDDQKALSYISKIESEAEKLSNINHN